MRFRTPIVFTPAHAGDRPSVVRKPATSYPQQGQSPCAPQQSQSPCAPKLRDRWPFLNEKDCPAELHALVGRRISMYNEYSNLYGQLRGCETVEELSAVCGRLLDAYLDNQSCTRELEYYQRHRRVLGRHPYLRYFRHLTLLRSMSVRDLIREEQKTKDNIWRVKTELRKGDKPHLEQKRRAKLQEYELKLQEISNLLGE